MKAKITNLRLNNKLAIDAAVLSFQEELSRLLSTEFYGSVGLVVLVEGGVIRSHRVNTSKRGRLC